MGKQDQPRRPQEPGQAQPEEEQPQQPQQPAPSQPAGGTEFPPDSDSSALNDPETEQDVPEQDEGSE